MSRETVTPIVVISGPSGCGKTTIVERLLAKPPVPLRKSVSATTRPPRTGEVNGEAYWFLSPEEFEARRNADAFLEVAEVHGAGHWYGTLKSEVERAWSEDAWSLLEIDVEGAESVMRLYPDSVTIFIDTPSEDAYERRLRARGTETEDVIKRRLETARRELERAERYRHRVVNDELDRAVGEIASILAQAETDSDAR